MLARSGTTPFLARTGIGEFMPDKDGDTKADSKTLPDTSLHAYADGRKEDIKGDSDKLDSDDPKDLQQSALEGKDEEGGATPKH
jgi:hypothetical protein